MPVHLLALETAVCDIKGEPLTSAAAVSHQRAGWPIANRPQLAKLPHPTAPSVLVPIRPASGHFASQSHRRPLPCCTPGSACTSRSPRFPRYPNETPNVCSHHPCPRKSRGPSPRAAGASARWRAHCHRHDGRGLFRGSVQGPSGPARGRSRQTVALAVARAEAAPVDPLHVGRLRVRRVSGTRRKPHRADQRPRRICSQSGGIRPDGHALFRKEPLQNEVAADPRSMGGIRHRRAAWPDARHCRLWRHRPGRGGTCPRLRHENSRAATPSRKVRGRSADRSGLPARTIERAPGRVGLRAGRRTTHARNARAHRRGCISRR